MNHYRSLLLLCLPLCWAIAASAGLNEKPPKNFDTAAVGAWQIDSARSDDPRAILEKAREKMANNRGSAGRAGEGGIGGPEAGGPGGRRGAGGGGPGGGGPGGSGGRGGGGSRGDRGMPPGGPAQSGGPAAVAQLLDDLAVSPVTLSITRANQRVKVLTGEHSISCMAGAVATISDSSGSGERRCGWSGSAWVVETKRGNDFERTDRYDPGCDGSTLTYTSKVTSQRLGSIKIVRVYTRLKD